MVKIIHMAWIMVIFMYSKYVKLMHGFFNKCYASILMKWEKAQLPKKWKKHKSYKVGFIITCFRLRDKYPFFALKIGILKHKLEEKNP